MILWFSSNYFYNFGLANTSVSSSTILSNTSSIFVYIIGMVLLPHVKFNPIKALMVLFSFGGIVLISISDETKGDHTFKGDLFSLLSSLCYGFYAVILKKRIPPEKEESFQFSYFLGFVGLFNMVVLLPLFPILNATGIETFEWPNSETLKALTLNAILGTVISDYCWA